VASAMSAMSAEFEALLMKLQECHKRELYQAHLNTKQSLATQAQRLAKKTTVLAPPEAPVLSVSIPESGHSPRMHTIQQTLESHLHPKKGKSHLAVRHQENTPPQKVAVKPGKKGCCCRVNDMLLQVIRHPMFDLSMSILIIINTLLFAFEAQYKGFNLAQALGLSEEHAEEVWPGARDFFENSEMIFGIIFTVEVAARLLLERLGFASDCWNWLDLSIVLFWLFSKTGSVLPVNSQVLRLLRLFRLLRMLSLVRKIKEFDALFLMTTAVRSSFGVLGWTAALLFVCQMMCALVIQQALSSFYFDGQNLATLNEQKEVYEYFGTFSRSLLSLFEMTLANWPPICRLLVNNVSEWWMIFCLLHKLTMGFAVIGVINGVLMQETFRVAHTDDNVMVREKQRAMRVHTTKMKALFDDADTSGDGKLDIEEFKAILLDSDVKIWLAAMDLDASDAEELFEMLDDGDGRLTAEELVIGVSKLRGGARAMDLRKLFPGAKAWAKDVVPDGILEVELEEMNAAKDEEKDEWDEHQVGVYL